MQTRRESPEWFVEHRFKQRQQRAIRHQQVRRLLPRSTYRTWGDRLFLAAFFGVIGGVITVGVLTYWPVFERVLRAVFGGN